MTTKEDQTKLFTALQLLLNTHLHKRGHASELRLGALGSTFYEEDGNELAIAWNGEYWCILQGDDETIIRRETWWDAARVAFLVVCEWRADKLLAELVDQAELEASRRPL